MAKYWTPGEVKTRLSQSMGDRRSAAIHRQFVIHLSRALQSAADQRFFAVTPTERMDDFSSVLPEGRWDIISQASGDLGQRMESWFRDRLSSTDGQPSTSVLIGSDCPTLNEADLYTAFDLLNSHDVVLGPASDGGYYLIGLRSPWRAEYEWLFADIPWSSDKVYRMTAQRIEQHGLRLATLTMREDIDTIDNLNRLRDRLSRSGVDDKREQELAMAIESILSEPDQ